MESPPRRRRYPTDLTDAQWQWLEPLLPPNCGAGRPTRVDLREIVNALLYLKQAGCAWRLLPHDFPNWTTVRYYFDKWTLDGTNSGPGGKGRRVRISGFEQWRMDGGGLVAESVGRFDAAEYQRQVEHGMDS